MLFLFYGHSKTTAKYALQILIIGSKCTEARTYFLEKWANSFKSSNCDWKVVLIEGLAIIRANRILRSIGFNLTDINVHYLPENWNTNLFIHPILKCMFLMCEQLQPDETKNLIDHIQKRTTKIEMNFSNENYLEIYMLHWLSESIIEAGDWTPYYQDTNKRDVHCNVRPILEFFKLTENDRIHEKIQSVYIRLAFTTKNIITAKKKIYTHDDSLSTSSEKTDKKNYLEKVPCHTATLTSIDNKDDRYEIRKSVAGIALIINQYKFKINSNLVNYSSFITLF